MHLATILIDDSETAVARRDEHYIPLASLDPRLPSSVKAVLEQGNEALALIAEALGRSCSGPAYKVAGAVHLPPISRPGKIICLGLNFRDHAAESGLDVPSYPSVFMRAATSLIGHGGAIVRPCVSTQLDFEVELAVVVGRRVRHQPAETALDVVAGYAVFNDASLRDFQHKSTQWTMGKNFDSTGAFGPELVTPDEIGGDPSALAMTTRLNGQLVQSSSTSQMIVGVGRMIAYASECMTLEPGDVVIMGTPAGVGAGRTPKLWMQPGDVCECEIEGIGRLSNPVAAE